MLINGLLVLPLVVFVPFSSIGMFSFWIDHLAQLICLLELNVNPNESQSLIFLIWFRVLLIQTLYKLTCFVGLTSGICISFRVVQSAFFQGGKSKVSFMFT